MLTSRLPWSFYSQVFVKYFKAPIPIFWPLTPLTHPATHPSYNLAILTILWSCFSYSALSILYPLLFSSLQKPWTYPVCWPCLIYFSFCSGLFQMPLAVLSLLSTINTVPLTITCLVTKPLQTGTWCKSGTILSLYIYIYHFLLKMTLNLVLF